MAHTVPRSFATVLEPSSAFASNRSPFWSLPRMFSRNRGSYFVNTLDSNCLPPRPPATATFQIPRIRSASAFCSGVELADFGALEDFADFADFADFRDFAAFFADMTTPPQRDADLNGRAAESISTAFLE